MLGLETAFDVRAAHGRANLILNQDGKNQVSAETLELFQVGPARTPMRIGIERLTACRRF